VRLRAASEAEGGELLGSDDPVLPGRHPADQEIHMHNCRIDILPPDLRQNCMAYVQFCR